MKQLLSIIFLVLLSTNVFAITISSASTGEVTNSGASFTVTLLKNEPIPAKPGSTVETWIQVSNGGDKSDTGLSLEVTEAYPFKPVSAADSLVQIGTLSARSDYVARVKLYVDSQASDGTYNVVVNLLRSDGSSKRFSLPLEVESGTSAVAITSVKTTPSALVPGSQSTLTVTVQNLEQSELQDVSVNIDFSDTVFAPVGSTNQQKLSRLAGGASHSFTYQVATQPDAAANVYRLPVTISATPNDGETLTQEETIGVLVSAQPELSVVVDSTTLTRGAKEGTVLLRLVNKGLSQIKFAQSTLESSADYELSGNNPVVYVGNIDSDDFETVEYTISPKADKFSLELQITYRDALNNAYEESVSIPLTVQEAQKSGNKLWVVLLVVVVAVVGIVLWRRSKKSKRS